MNLFDFMSKDTTYTHKFFEKKMLHETMNEAQFLSGKEIKSSTYVVKLFREKCVFCYCF